jgi:hypothetical protein
MLELTQGMVTVDGKDHYEVITGHARLHVALELQGHALVYDVGEGEAVDVVYDATRRHLIRKEYDDVPD